MALFKEFSMDKKKYLSKIAYSGDLNPSLDLLCKLQKAHLLHIPFENLDIHYGQPIDLKVDKIFKKIILENRGGFCYELNGLFYELLTSLGFFTKRISGRVYNAKKGYGQEFDHLALVVTIDDTDYLTDVGFGEFTFAPLKLELNTLQQDARGDFVLDKYDETYFRVNKIVDGVRVPEYIFKNIAREFAAYSAMCHYHQTSSDSHFTQKKLITRPTENGRITISQNILKIKENENLQEIILENERAFEEALWVYFGVSV